ncbi:hypothetical protein ZOD2009_11010 [Haladaptatus paucihalophilus DX253]|uniref:Uncharacterized protein n=1 Tax=Haladaptatus paucihalophilus DX253 TaxID=797209 RepID=E7QTS4_HALPU|nr:hypothetical protein [Haladaptatus paucihalophilus]EFW92003.1 hypothetical protein ZOD2009_11010 [Haladaptatus paucihalophilus DX253]SHK85491.1 hypothetical protein SAMN05444342_2406 [Haladaptatus paucihalophilus DX253]
MNRRTLLAGISLPLVGGGVVVAQQLDYRRDKDFSIRTDPPITEHEFELVDVTKGFDDENYDPGKQFGNYATVEFDSTENRVRVLGQVKSGGRSCKETELKSLRYDERSDTLTVAVFDDYISHGVCTLELGIVPYTVSVNFESDLPSRVVVAHVKDAAGIIDGENVVYEKAFSSENRN